MWRWYSSSNYCIKFHIKAAIVAVSCISATACGLICGWQQSIASAVPLYQHPSACLYAQQRLTILSLTPECNLLPPQWPLNQCLQFPSFRLAALSTDKAHQQRHLLQCFSCASRTSCMTGSRHDCEDGKVMGSPAHCKVRCSPTPPHTSRSGRSLKPLSPTALTRWKPK